MAKFTFSKRDVYLEIAERYEKYISLGVLKDGERLPSVRVAAGELGVNPNTVQRALSLLEDDGLIYSKNTVGIFVTEDTELIAKMREQQRAKTIKRFVEMADSEGITIDELIEYLRRKKDGE